MNLELTDKVALVTGSSRGIGKAIAQALHREGCKLMLNGRNAPALAAACAELGERASYHAADATDPDACRALIGATVARWGAIDVLVCNAGSGASVRPGEETPAEWRRLLGINFASATNMVEAARDALARTRGSIVCISSICGVETIPGAPLTYSAAKAALNSYVRGVCRPLGTLGVRINAIAPGNIVFDGSIWERKLKEDPAAVNAMLAREVALACLGRPEDVANMACFLASSAAGFATGSIHVLDGGQVRG
jgi:3-oxoacyl-[acyl-carrier protein] reductase